MANAVAAAKGVEVSADVMDDIFETAGDGAAFDSSEMQIPFVRIREQGGGFQGEIPANDPVLTKTTREGAREILPNGHELVKSDQHYCLVVDGDGSFQPAVIDMKSSQLKVSRRWKTQIAMQKVKHPKTEQMVTPAVYATMWNLSTTEESNDQGTWGNYQVSKVDLVNSRDLLQEAKAFRESIMAGEVKAAADPEHTSTGSSQNESDNDIPF